MLMRYNTIKFWTIAIVFLGSFYSGFFISAAWALEPTKGKTLLTVTGKVGIKNTATAATFDLAMLEQLPAHSFTTLTPWDKKPLQFKGPLLRDVLAAAKAHGTTIKALALDGYQTTLPFQDAQEFDVIVAYQMNHAYIPVRTKGPLFIVYPFHRNEALRSSTYYARSAWQLKTLTIE